MSSLMLVLGCRQLQVSTTRPAAPSAPDLSAAALRGNDHVDDSFSMAMVAAAKALDSKAAAGYETVYCHSTNAFAPMVNAGEDCTAHWACEAWLADRAMDNVAASLGLRASELDLPEFDHTWDDTRKREARRRVAAVARQAMDRGGVVLTTGGWDVGLKQVDGKWKAVGPHGFVFWGAAGIVTHADPATGELLGAHPNGHRDNPIVRPATMWALTRDPGEPADARSVDRVALRLAVDRIRSRGRFGREGNAVYGADAMRAWADHMARVKGFCAPCFGQGPKASVGDAVDNGKRLHKAAGITARYLRSVREGLPPGAAGHLEAAATRYDRIAELIAPSVTGGSPAHYKHWLGDMGKQREHAGLLRGINDELLGAAASIASALGVESPAEAAAVRREGGRVWVDNVPLAKGRGNGYVRGLEALLAHAGTPVSYERLMGLSGMAFIAQADTEHRWEGKVDVGWWPLDPWGLLLRRAFLGRAIGYELQEIGWLTLTPDRFLAVRDRLPEVYRQHIEPHVNRSIDAGRPLLATCDFGFVVSGYDSTAGQPPVLGRCASDTERRQYRSERWPIGLIALGKRTVPMRPEAADVTALRNAVALAHDRAGPPEAHWRARRFTGQKAFAAWSSLLRDTAEPVEDRHHANMRQNLLWNRTAAIAYLREVARRSEEGAAEALGRAVASYETVLEQLSEIKTEGLSRSHEARRGLADRVDRIADLELGAATHTERAAIEMSVQRDGGKVRIEGVRGFDAGEFASSPHGCQIRILQALGESITYDDLVCYSAFAFRVSVHDGMCPSAGHPYCGFRCNEGATNALPWRARFFEAFPGAKPKEDQAAFEAEACAAIKDSIDRGIPVHYGSEEDGLIVGYADGGRRWLCVHPYHKNGKEAFWFDEVKGFAGGKWPWGIVVWTEPVPVEDRVPPRELTLAALKQAVEMWTTEKRGDYFVGDAAYAHWLKWLSDVEAGRVEDPKAGMQGNGWCFDVLLHSRRIATRWLRSRAEGFGDEAREKLLVAADHYEHMAEGLIAGLECPWDLALPPNRHSDWTSAMRQDQIERLEAAREHDRKAIAAIEKALAVAAP